MISYNSNAEQSEKTLEGTKNKRNIQHFPRCACSFHEELKRKGTERAGIRFSHVSEILLFRKNENIFQNFEFREKKNQRAKR